MAEYTLTYSISEDVSGWPSFYSYMPEWIIGTNNYLYTFQDGQLWRHNTNETRNNFYGVQYGASVLTVLNKSPLETKVFKTLELLGTPGVGWAATFTSNLQTGDYISEWEEKEGKMFASISSLEVNTDIASDVGGANNAQQLDNRSAQGVGNFGVGDVEVIAGTQMRINFALGFVINNIVSIGDIAFIMYTDGSETGWRTGTIIDIGTNPNTASLLFTQPCIDVETVGYSPPNTSAATSPTRFFYIIKNQAAESYGLLGDYAEVGLSITSTANVELFTISSEVMKSSP